MSGQTNAQLQAKLTIATEALRKAEERALAGQFALEVMHEIRNPLDALGHLVYLADADAEDPVKVHDHLARAREQIATVHQIAAQTLGFVQQVSAPRQIDLVALVEAALRIHHRRIQSQCIHLLRDLPDGIMARVHASEILQVVVNLLANSADALAEGGTISVRLRKKGGFVRLIVADNGHGISETNLRRLFEPFFTTKQDRGTGLGLALSKKIIERHGGEITARSSVAIHRSGTTFRITLPS